MPEKLPSAQIEALSAATELNEAGLERLSEEERKAWYLFVKRHKQSSIQLSDFSDVYDKDVIKKDEEYVSKRERGFKDNNDSIIATSQRRGELLEALLDDGIKNAKWMGPETMPITPSRYDDIKNGVDLVLEFFGKEGFTHLALNIDITSSSEEAENKLLAIKDNLLEGRLSDVKYFKSDRANFRGVLEKIPKVIIGIDPKHIRELCLARVEIVTFKKGLKLPENQSTTIQNNLKNKIRESTQKFVKSIVRLIIIKEIEIQLIKFRDFSREQNKEIIADKYQASFEALQRIKSAGNETPNLEEEVGSDEVFRSIETALKSF